MSDIVCVAYNSFHFSAPSDDWRVASRVRSMSSTTMTIDKRQRHKPWWQWALNNKSSETATNYTVICERARALYSKHLALTKHANAKCFDAHMRTIYVYDNIIQCICIWKEKKTDPHTRTQQQQWMGKHRSES